MRNIQSLVSKLNLYHEEFAGNVQRRFSKIAGNQFPGDFNVSGFHERILRLPDHPSSFWGIDRCLRIRERTDALHSLVFHVGIYAKSVDLNDTYREPWSDPRFHEAQAEVLDHFFKLLRRLHIPFGEMEATYFAGASVGGTREGRDSLLAKKYDFPPDGVSRRSLKKWGVAAYPANGISNIDIRSSEGALVGPRVEVSFRGIEIATIVFDCFRFASRTLRPINYTVGYAIGIERLFAALASNRGFLHSVPRYKNVLTALQKMNPALTSSLFTHEAERIIYAAEALAVLPNTLSRKQKELKRKLIKEMRSSLSELGLTERAFRAIVRHFALWKSSF